MNYKIGRTDKVIDTLELTDQNGEIVKIINVNFDIDASARDMEAQYEKLIGINKSLNELLRRGNHPEYAELAKIYTEEVTVLFKMCFGIEQTLEIYEFFDNNCIEMVQQVLPYIFKRLLPKIKKSVKKQKIALKKAFK